MLKFNPILLIIKKLFNRKVIFNKSVLIPFLFIKNNLLFGFVKKKID